MALNSQSHAIRLPALDAGAGELVAALSPLRWNGAQLGVVGLERLLSWSRHDNRAVRDAAVRGLGAIASGDSRATAALRYALGDEARSVRESAAEALRSLRALPEDWSLQETANGWRPRAPCTTALVRDDGEYRTAGEILRDPSVYLGHLRAKQRLSCCSFGAGFEIAADGIPWFGRALIDEFENASWWLPALASLLEGETEVRIWAWEESGMIAWRIGEDVILEDVHHTGDVACARVTFELKPLVEVLCVAVEELADVVDLLNDRLRGTYEIDADLRDGLARARRHVGTRGRSSCERGNSG